jgi:hypothetical protein
LRRRLFGCMRSPTAHVHTGILLLHSPRFLAFEGKQYAHRFASGTLLYVPSTFTTRLTYCNAVGYKTLEALQENSPGVSRTGTSLASPGSAQVKQDNTHSVLGLAELPVPSRELAFTPFLECPRLLGELFLSRTW